MYFSTAFYSLVAATAFSGAVVLAQDRDPLNSIDDTCSPNFSEDIHAIICTRAGANSQFTMSSTSYVRGTDDHICCPTDNTCVLSNDTTPRVGCFDPTKKSVSIAEDGGPCDLKGGTCAWGGTHGGAVTFSDKGVTKYTAVKNGKGVEGGSSSSSSSSGSSTSSSSGSSSSASGKSAAVAVHASYVGTLTVAILGVGASLLLW